MKHVLCHSKHNHMVLYDAPWWRTSSVLEFCYCFATAVRERFVYLPGCACCPSACAACLHICLAPRGFCSQCFEFGGNWVKWPHTTTTTKTTKPDFSTARPDVLINEGRSNMTSSSSQNLKQNPCPTHICTANHSPRPQPLHAPFYSSQIAV